MAASDPKIRYRLPRSLQAAMALSEEQQESLANDAEVLVGRLTGLTRRHCALDGDTADLQLRLPGGRHAGPGTPGWHVTHR